MYRSRLVQFRPSTQLPRCKTRPIRKRAIKMLLTARVVRYLKMLASILQVWGGAGIISRHCVVVFRCVRERKLDGERKD